MVKISTMKRMAQNVHYNARDINIDVQMVIGDALENVSKLMRSKLYYTNNKL